MSASRPPQPPPSKPQQEKQPPNYRIVHLEDFTAHAWCNALLSDPSIATIQKRIIPPRIPGQAQPVSNSFFTKTLFNDNAVRAFLSMYRPGRGRAQNLADAGIAGDALLGSENEGKNINGDEGVDEMRHEGQKGEVKTIRAETDGPKSLILASIGKQLDGGIDRLHGGVTATLMDQVMGILVSYSHKSSCATAELTIKYKKPVVTPCVLLCRARIVREAGRWIELVGWIEDGEGTVFAEGRGAFVKARVGDGRGTGGWREEKKMEAKI